jgi:hypothetical protein
VSVSLLPADSTLGSGVATRTGYVRVEVQGHPAYSRASTRSASATDPAIQTRQIFVPGFHGGTLLITGSGADGESPNLPIDQLLEIAEGVQWDG